MPTLRHLQQQKSELDMMYQLLSERIQRIQAAYVVETDPEQRFKYEKSLAQLKTQRDQLDDQLAEFEDKADPRPETQAHPAAPIATGSNAGDTYRNPYQISRPVTDSDAFFGREPVLRRVYHLLQTNQTVNIVGARRLGKTSVLNMIQSPVMRHRIVGSHPHELDAACFVRCDVQCGMDMTPQEWLRTLATEVRAIWPNMPEVNGYNDFEEGLRQLANAQRQLIILWDEFDCVARNPYFDKPFF